MAGRFQGVSDTVWEMMAPYFSPQNPEKRGRGKPPPTHARSSTPSCTSSSRAPDGVTFPKASPSHRRSTSGVQGIKSAVKFKGVGFQSLSVLCAFSQSTASVLPVPP